MDYCLADENWRIYTLIYSCDNRAEEGGNGSKTLLTSQIQLYETVNMAPS